MPFSSEERSRIAPFAAFMICIAIEQILRYLVEDHPGINSGLIGWLYLPRIALVGLLLFAYRDRYVELAWPDLRDLRCTLLSSAVGVLVFILWINMDWTFSWQGTPPGFDPGAFSDGPARVLVTIGRVAGAVVVVPVMEELFWRSFLLRYLVKSDFLAVEIGRVTPFSFLAVMLLFGFEHHYLVAGIMAGAAFNLVYLWTRSIVQCVLTHAVANLCLALYVLQTGEWRFW